MVEAKDDIVIFVHGTFAASDLDTGSGWWQRGSDNWIWFDEHLPDGVSLPEESAMHLRWDDWNKDPDNEEEKPKPTLFHWNGKNGQICRLEASNRLLALLLELERQGLGYHLVGHSHGGSVIWEALISAEVTRGRRTVDPDLRRALNKMKLVDEPLIPLRYDEYAPWWLKYKTRYIPQEAEFRAVESFIDLPGLRSWTTVGTPFLHHLPSRRFLVKGWPHPKLSLNPERSDVQWSVIVDSLLRLVMIVPFLLPGALIFDPVRTALADAPSNWFTYLFAVLVALIWVVAFVTVGNRNYANALVARERVAQQVVQRFHKRWLGLWAPEDEAIAGLAWLAPNIGGYDYEWLCTSPRTRGERPEPTKPNYSFTDRFNLRMKIPITDVHLIPHVLLLAPRRMAKPGVLAFNRFLAPRFGRFMVHAFRDKAQGVDLPRASLVYTSPWPLPLAPVCPGLPPDVIERIQTDAGRDASAVGALARKLVMIATLQGLPEARTAYREMYDGTPLVHTSYFNDEAVRILIKMHIAGDDGHAPAESQELSRWLAATTAATRVRIEEFTSERL